MNTVPRKLILGVVAIAVAWGVASWFIARANFLLRADETLRYASQLTGVRAQDLADSIRENIGHLGGIPELFARNSSIKHALSEHAPRATASLPYVPRKRALTLDPGLSALDQRLREVRDDLKVDLIFVLDASGTCIAASNWDDPASNIGTSYADREFFQMNRRGERGMQYAVGRTTHIPGLHFSTPIFDSGRFIGAVVVNVDTQQLSFLIEQSDAYVADKNGVVILARDAAIVMHALPGAAVQKLPMEARQGIYQRSEFPELRISSWSNDERFDMLKRIEDETVPHMFSSVEIPAYGLRVYTQDEVPVFLDLEDSRQTLFWMLAAGGWAAAALAAAIFAYLQNMSRAKNEMEYLANHDTLTQLPNRRHFLVLLEREIGRLQERGGAFALLRIGLEGFKEVNDTWGHHMGDALLVQVAERMRVCMGESDVIARIGGNEFVLLTWQAGDRAQIRSVAVALMRRLAEPYQMDQEFATISASIGIALCPDDATEPDSLLIRADQAMYAAKQAGNNHINFFVPVLEQRAHIKRLLIKDMVSALLQKQFQVFYQPIVEIQTGRVRKAEALVRWRHPVHGYISPADFIPLAETSGMITDIGDWVFGQAAHQASLWRRQYDPTFQVSVNKSPVQFRNAAIKQREGWLAHMQKHGLSGDSICVEITEGLLMHAEEGVIEKLLEFSQNGVQLSLDDFGTGYSSLAYLKKFDIDYIKIDRSFVRDLARSNADIVLCQAIVSMAHQLGLKVIAEGVETERQRDMLAAMRCDYAQGFLYSRPIPPDEFERLFWAQDSGQAVLGSATSGSVPVSG